MVSLNELLTNPNFKGSVKIEVTGPDLLDFGKEIVRSTLDKAESSKHETEPEEYLTRDEVSKLLKVCTTTLWHWNRKGILNSFRIGNKVRYKRSQISDSFTLIKKGG